MTGDRLEKPPHGSARSDRAVFQVFTEPQLVRQVASFQRRLPRVVGPLVCRYLAAYPLLGRHGTTTSHADVCALWDRESAPSTPLTKRAGSMRKWRELVTAEAVARYDEAPFEVLQYLLTTACDRHANPRHLQQRLWWLVWGAAVAFGRIDMLVYLDKSANAVAPSLYTSAGVSSYAMIQAAYYGHVDVLDWLEARFGLPPAEWFRYFDLKPVLLRGHAKAAHWMRDRQLGASPVGAAYVALERGDFALFRTAIDLCPELIAPPRNSDEEKRALQLSRCAFSLNRCDAVVYMVERGCPFRELQLQEAIQRRDFRTLPCMLSNLRGSNSVHVRCGRLWSRETLLCELISNDVDGRVLKLLNDIDLTQFREVLSPSVLSWVGRARFCKDYYAHKSTLSDGMLQWLLRESPVGDVSKVAIELALAQETALLERVLAFMERPLPPVVLSCIHRITTSTLGPVASLAVACSKWGPNGHLIETMLHGLPAALSEDVRDTVLCQLCLSSYGLRRILAASTETGACDEDFWNVCLSLRSSTSFKHNIEIELHCQRLARCHRTED